MKKKRGLFQATKEELSKIITGAKLIFRKNKNNEEGQEISWGKAMRISWARFKFRKLFLATNVVFRYFTSTGRVRRATALRGIVYKPDINNVFTIEYFDVQRNAKRSFNLSRFIDIVNIKGTKIEPIGMMTTQNVIHLQPMSEAEESKLLKHIDVDPFLAEIKRTA